MRILIVDDFDETRELLNFTIRGYADVECIEAATADQAIDHLKSGTPFDLVIVDALMPGKPGATVILWGLEHQVHSQFILMSAGPVSENSSLSQHQNEVWHLPKPFLGKDVELLIQRYCNGPLSTSDRDYIPVVLPLLRKLGVIPVPLFIRINDQKFVRLTTGTADFTDDEFLKYKHRGIKELFVESANGERLIQEFRSRAFQDEQWSAPIDPNAPKLDFQSEAVMGLTNRLGLDETTQAQLKETTDRTFSIVAQRAELGTLIKEFKKANRWGLSDRTALTLTVAAGLLRSVGEWNENAIKTMAFAAILHDMAISDMQPFSVKKTIKAIEMGMDSSNPDVIRVREHTLKAADYSKLIPGCPPETANVILSHHEKPNGRGFPNKATAFDLSFLQSVFVFSVDFATAFVESEGTMDIRSFLVVRKDLYQDSHFRMIHVLFTSSMKQNDLHTE